VNGAGGIPTSSPTAWTTAARLAARVAGRWVIARIDNRRMARALLALNVPVVNLRAPFRGCLFPFIGADNGAVARMGAEHLLERGFRTLGFCGFRRGFHPGLDRRGDCFRRLIEAAGYQCSLYHQPRASRGESRPADEQRRLPGWIRSLPKPVGILAANDDRGLDVLNACGGSE